MTTDTPSDLVKRLRALFIMDEANSDNPLGQEAADRIEELEKMLATESEVTLKFSEAIDRLERERDGWKEREAQAHRLLDIAERELAEAQQDAAQARKAANSWKDDALKMGQDAARKP